MQNRKNLKIDHRNNLDFQLEESKKILSFLQTSLSSDNCGIIIVDDQGNIVNFNDKFVKIWKIPDLKLLSGSCAKIKVFLENQIEDKNKLNQLFNEKSVSRVSSALQDKKQITKKKNFFQENKSNVLKLKDGRSIVQILFLQKLEDKVITNLWFFWDASKLLELKQKELEEEIDDSFIQKIAKNDSVKSIFFAKICHQFRSLLNIIAFSNSVLKSRILAKANQQENLLFIDNIQSGVEEISQLLEELVFYGKLLTGEIKYNPNIVNLNLLCEEVVKQAPKNSIYKQQTINVNNCCDCQMVYLDEKLFKSTINYILSNAINYSSEKSTILLKISCKKQKIIFQVEDKGIGIEEQDLPEVFEPFFRGKNIAKEKGNGIGLAIVKNLVDLQGGSIDVSSQIRTGTTFRIMLPFLNS